jgi:uncharacterized protein YdhG (YjbR/CyaY superfamily)
MQYQANTPSEYLAQLDQDWRKDQLESIRAMIQRHGPTLTEGMEYRMLCYGQAQKQLFHLNAQRAYVSLYVGDIAKVEGGQALLEGFDTGKGCIRIKKTTDLSDGRLEAFIEKAIARWEQGADLGC